MPSNVLFSPQPNNNEFTVKETERNQEIFWKFSQNCLFFKLVKREYFLVSLLLYDKLNIFRLWTKNYKRRTSFWDLGSTDGHFSVVVSEVKYFNNVFLNPTNQL